MSTGGGKNEREQVAAGATVAGAAAPAAAESRGLLHGPFPLFSSILYLIFSIYMHLIMYLKYFNENKPRVPKVPRVSFDTA